MIEYILFYFCKDEKLNRNLQDKSMNQIHHIYQNPLGTTSSMVMQSYILYKFHLEKWQSMTDLPIMVVGRNINVEGFEG